MIFEIIGTPLQKQSARFAKRGRFMKSYQPKNVVNYAAQAKIQVIDQLPEGFVPFSGKIKVIRLTFVFPPLKSWSKKKLQSLRDGSCIYKDTKPDLDNLEKMIYDCCNGVVWTDDAKIVCKGGITKVFGEVPKTILEVVEIEEEVR